MNGRASVVPGQPAVPAQQAARQPARQDGGGAALRPVLRLSALDLAPLDGAVPSARLHARHVARECGQAELAGDCELVVAELVTNAVQACARLALAMGETAAGGVVPPVRLRLTCRGGGLRVEVWDGSDELPAPGRDRGEDEPGGWGLVLVQALADRWGTYRTAGGGKCVWAILGGAGIPPE